MKAKAAELLKPGDEVRITGRPPNVRYRWMKELVGKRGVVTGQTAGGRVLLVEISGASESLWFGSGHLEPGEPPPGESSAGEQEAG